MIDTKLRPTANYPSYPPFKDGLYLEEYFYNYLINNKIVLNNYIDIFWTNIKCNEYFNQEKIDYNYIIDYVNKFQNNDKSFTIVQHDDGVFIGGNFKKFSAGGVGDIAIPLIYEDKKELFFNNRLSYSQKTKFCTFNGALTHSVRHKMYNVLSKNKLYDFSINTWNIQIPNDKQKLYLENIISSKYVLCPRGYGRSSFRFYEVLEAGAIPIYIYDDIEFLPYKDELDWNNLCISLHIDNIHLLHDILNSFDERKYNTYISNYLDVREKYFKMDSVCKYIIEKI